jgi:hypothetical protein
MTKTRPRQLELPVMVDLNGKAQAGNASGRSVQMTPQSSTASGFHKPASAGDQSIYKTISDNYFNTSVKRAC